MRRSGTPWRGVALGGLAAVVLASCGAVDGVAPSAIPATGDALVAVTVPVATPVGGVPPGGSVRGDVADVVVGAMRDASATVGATCDLGTVEALARRHPDAGQWIVARTASFTATAATLDVVVRSRTGNWVCQRGGQAALVGRAGTRPLTDRRSGDGTAPAGVFPLGTTTAWDGQAFQFFGNGVDPGVRGSYRAVQPGDCWGATPGRASYNHLVRDPTCATGDDEYLPSITGAYVHAAVIGANNEPSVSGDEPGEVPYAAAIFLHRHAYDGARPKPTSGCVSLALEDLVPTLALIDPARSPRFAIGPADWLRSDA